MRNALTGRGLKGPYHKGSNHLFNEKQLFRPDAMNKILSNGGSKSLSSKGFGGALWYFENVRKRVRSNRAYFNMLTGEAIASPVIEKRISPAVMTICLPS